jgi:hypothetical protein
MKYLFYYPDYNIRQEKVLIPHEAWELSREMSPDKGKKYLKEQSSGEEWFTDKSPLFEAIKTGILNCNGIHKCIVTKL